MAEIVTSERKKLILPLHLHHPHSGQVKGLVEKLISGLDVRHIGEEVKREVGVKLTLMMMVMVMLMAIEK